MADYQELFIGGEWVAPAGQGRIEVISPVTEEVYGTVPDAAEADVDRAVAAARRAFDEGPWPRMAPEARADAIARLSAELQARSKFGELPGLLQHPHFAAGCGCRLPVPVHPRDAPVQRTPCGALRCLPRRVRAGPPGTPASHARGGGCR